MTFQKSCQLMEDWMLDIKENSDPLVLVSELSATCQPCSMMLMLPVAAESFPRLTCVNSVIHTLQRRCRCRWLRTKEISRERCPELHEWCGNAFWFSVASVLLPLRVQLLCALCLVHFAQPPTSCFAVVLLTLLVWVRVWDSARVGGWCAANTKVRQWKSQVKTAMMKLCWVVVTSQHNSDNVERHEKWEVKQRAVVQTPTHVKQLERISRSSFFPPSRSRCGMKATDSWPSTPRSDVWRSQTSSLCLRLMLQLLWLPVIETSPASWTVKSQPCPNPHGAPTRGKSCWSVSRFLFLLHREMMRFSCADGYFPQRSCW